MTAAAFHALHAGPGVLILANAWDAGSARLIVHLGARAVATTSAAVAWAHGYPDGDALPVPLLTASVAAICAAVAVPVTVDVEGGYSDDPAAVEATVGAVIEAGGVGINIEDGGGAPELLCAKIAAARRAGQARGVDLFVNARTDVYLRGLAAGTAAVTETIRRAGLYQTAGASGIFVPGLADPDAIRAIAATTPLPLNLLARAGLPDAAVLGALGVRRLSSGSGIAQAAWAEAQRRAAAFLRDGDSDALSAGAADYGAINAMMAR